MLSQSDAAPAEQYQTSRKLTELLQSCSENQSCADCKSRLMDSIWASTTVGAFLCIHCAGAHRTLGVQLSRVKSIHLDTWTDEEVAAMKGGNKGVNEVYSKYLDKWIAADASLELLPNTATDVREKCIRAKYQDKQFTRLPSQVDKKDQDRPENPEQLSPSAASSAVNTEAASAGPNQQLSPGKTAQLGNSAVIKPGSVVEVTKRLLNYFIVVGRGALVADQKIETTKSPTEIRFLPTVIDAYPDTHGDAPVPAHIGEFAFPEGFALSKSYVAPVFFSFVLTNVVLCSKRIGLLTPVAEALLSILLPFSWQGAYIPVLPTSLLDVIDAPVPFIVGTHSGCLKQLAGRTTNVVFIDLDHNRVIPANPPSTHVKSGEQDLFDSKRFLQENFDNVSRPFVALLISTQMFDRFIEDRVFNPKLPEVLFFDQSINQKLNRSLTIGKKKYDCSFLEDRSDEIQETFIAPPPSNIGLPDDGTIYKYKSFPRLKKTLFGNVRKPRELYTSREQQRNVSRVTFNQALFKAGRWKIAMFEAYRRKIYDLWDQGDTSLLYRSTFWVKFKTPDFFTIGVYQEEEARLQATCSHGKTFFGDHPHLSEQRVDGAKRDEIRGSKLTAIQRMISPKQPKVQKFGNTLSSECMKIERGKVYTGLKYRTSPSVRMAYFEKFGIKPDSKKRKKKLAALVWTSFDTVDISAEVVITASAGSEEAGPTSAQIERQKERRLRDNLAFTEWTLSKHDNRGDTLTIFTAPQLPGDGRYIPCERDREWFPAVGLDSPNVIHVNFGQQPFACDYVIDELFSECTGSGAALTREMLRSTNNVRIRKVRRTCIDAFISSVRARRRLTQAA
ncbi:hypothetical protein PHYBOEH_005909 [Phytophthora boehmeriae]|uniref:Arf-GAP domain-containing protein n=1 Tax=Phytophthora boehmeriae TaxID=109152 RepID=A0A8T1WQM4_9STRA|nr:hypothetical protein PHYBOEH_005909 [Phytophthora boehmeriae]